MPLPLLLLSTPLDTMRGGWWATSTLGLLLLNAGSSPGRWWLLPGEPGADWLALISLPR